MAILLQENLFDLVITCIAIGAAYFAFSAFNRRYLSTISDIPGPFLASVSVLWEVWGIVRGDIDWRCIKLHQKHGHFVRISHEEISVSHPEAIRRILAAPLRKSEWYGVIALPDYRFQTPMSEQDPVRHVQRRKNLAPGFAMTHIIKSELYINDCVSLLKQRLVEYSETNKPVNLDDWFNYMAYDVIGEVLFSKPFGFLKAATDIGGSIANSRVLTRYVTIAGFFQKIHRMTLGSPIISDLKLMPTQHIFDTCLTAIDARLNNPDARNDVLALWMRQHTEHPDKMEEKELYGCINMTVGAGADTVSSALQAFFYYMIRFPKYIEKLRKEISDANLTDDVISYADASQLPFFTACVKEALRIHTPIAIGLARVVPEQGITIGGRFFEAGTKLSVNPWVMHYSAELFGEDADIFNPNRWLEPRGLDMEQYFMPFGVGYNSCQGRNLALLEIFKVASTLARDFDFSQVDPSKSWTYEALLTAVPFDWPCHVQRRVSTNHGS